MSELKSRFDKSRAIDGASRAVIVERMGRTLHADARGREDFDKRFDDFDGMTKVRSDGVRRVAATTYPLTRPPLRLLAAGRKCISFVGYLVSGERTRHRAREGERGDTGRVGGGGGILLGF